MSYVIETPELQSSLPDLEEVPCCSSRRQGAPRSPSNARQRQQSRRRLGSAASWAALLPVHCLALAALFALPGECQPGGIPWEAHADTATYSKIPFDNNDQIIANQIVPIGWGSTTMMHTGTDQNLGPRTIMYGGQDQIYTTCTSLGTRLALSTCGATLPLIAPFAVGVSKSPCNIVAVAVRTQSNAIPLQCCKTLRQFVTAGCPCDSTTLQLVGLLGIGPEIIQAAARAAQVSRCASDEYGGPIQSLCTTFKSCELYAYLSEVKRPPSPARKTAVPPAGSGLGAVQSGGAPASAPSAATAPAALPGAVSPVGPRAVPPAGAVPLAPASANPPSSTTGNLRPLPPSVSNAAAATSPAPAGPVATAASAVVSAPTGPRGPQPIMVANAAPIRVDDETVIAAGPSPWTTGNSSRPITTPLPLLPQNLAPYIEVPQQGRIPQPTLPVNPNPIWSAMSLPRPHPRPGNATGPPV